MVGLREAVVDHLPVAVDRSDGGIGAPELVQAGPGDVGGNALQPVVQRLGVQVQVHEHQAGPSVHPHGHQRHIVVAQQAEASPGRDLPDPAGEIPRPAVIGAAQLAHAGAGALADGVAPVAADVLKTPEGTVVAPHQQDRVPAEPVLEPVAGVGDMVHGAGHVPHPGPHPLVLQIGEPGRDVAMDGDPHRGVGGQRRGGDGRGENLGLVRRCDISHAHNRGTPPVNRTSVMKQVTTIGVTDTVRKRS